MATSTSGSVYLNVRSSGVVADLVAVADSGSTQALSDNGFLNGTYLTEVDGTSSGQSSIGYYGSGW